MKTLALALSIAGVQAADIHGQYVEARTADIYTGPCFANSEVELTGNLAVLGWKIEKGRGRESRSTDYPSWAWCVRKTRSGIICIPM